MAKYGWDSNQRSTQIDDEEHGAVGDVITGRKYKGVQLVPQAVTVDEVSASETYVGFTRPGTAEDVAQWRIMKISKVGNVTKIQLANGEDTFVNRWDQRVSLSYS